MVARKYLRSFQNPRNAQMFSFMNDSQYTVFVNSAILFCKCPHIVTIASY